MGGVGSNDFPFQTGDLKCFHVNFPWCSLREFQDILSFINNLRFAKLLPITVGSKSSMGSLPKNNDRGGDCYWQWEPPKIEV